MAQDAMTHLTYEAADVLDICRSFEHAYGTTSEDFFTRYQRGEFAGSHDAARWAGYWREVLELRQESPTSPSKGTDEGLLNAVC